MCLEELPKFPVDFGRCVHPFAKRRIGHDEGRGTGEGKSGDRAVEEQDLFFKACLMQVLST